MAIDVNVISVNALGDQYDHVAKLSTAADAKNRKFKQACADANINFIPLVFNTYGAIHQESGPEKERDGLVILNQVANRYASLHDMSFPEAKLRIITRISFALKRGVVDQLCRRLPITQASSWAYWIWRDSSVSEATATEVRRTIGSGLGGLLYYALLMLWPCQFPRYL